MNSPSTTTLSSSHTQGPKYCQVIDLIMANIKANILNPGDRIPSIKEASEEHLISRDTVEKAYRELSQRGILISVPGKGYYVKGSSSSRLRIMALLPEPDAEEQLFYDSFLRGIGKQAVSHLYCFGKEAGRFTEILNHHLGDYDYYLIWPRFIGEDPEVKKLIRKIPQNKLIHLNEMVPAQAGPLTEVLHKQLEDHRFAAYQSWETISPCMESSLQLQWNHLLKLTAERGERTFNQSCLTEESTPVSGRLYFVWEDQDLVKLLDLCKQHNLIPGQDVGIISLKEHPLKKVLAGGITTLALSASQLGSFAAANILQQSRDVLDFQATLEIRPSV